MFQNTVVGGNPAKVIGSIHDQYKKRLPDINSYPEDLKPEHQRIKKQLADVE